MLVVSGASDDLIMIDGDFSEEFTLESGSIAVLGFSDGTLLQVQYGAGRSSFWRIQPLIYGRAKYSKTEATNEAENYSDVVTLDGEIKWVVCGVQWARP